MMSEKTLWKKTDAQLIKKYRLDRAGVQYLCDELHDDLARPTRRSNALSVAVQVCAALGFFAKGSFQDVTGDTLKVSRYSVSRCVHTVSDALIERLLPRHIKFTRHIAEQRQTKEDFYQLRQFPNVLGTVDGSLVPIIGPLCWRTLVCLHKAFSCDQYVQGVIGPDGRFLDIVARWPGGTHDSYIWKNSGLCSEIKGGWLLGDSGCGLAPWLLTPIQNPSNRAERAYNRTEYSSGQWRLWTRRNGLWW